MNNHFKTTFKTILAIGDTIALLASFIIAYILRVKLTNRPTAIQIGSIDFISSIAILIPLWITVLYTLGLYRDQILQKPKEIPRLFFSSIIGVMLMISFAYFTDNPIFPSKLVALYALIISFILMTIIRWLVYGLRHALIRAGYGHQRVLIVGNDETNFKLVDTINQNPSLGYQIIGFVADEQFIPHDLRNLKFNSVKGALKLCIPDVIIQTDTHRNLQVYELAVDRHLRYSYIPSHKALDEVKYRSEIVGLMPIIDVQTTPLVGYGQIVKRLMDIVVGLFFIVLSSPLWLIVIIIAKIMEPTAPIFFKQQRLSRFNTTVNIYKFRSMKQQYSGLSPEEAFTKMNRPELSAQYRAGGDQLANDPRITPLGRFLRKTSLDELPQLINVVKGDISLVGPRALVPSELKQYPYKNLILTVKSGLTGLAQVSGRRDISFEERRALDIYYVHNWSVMLDLQIILKTIIHVLFGKGAR